MVRRTICAALTAFSLLSLFGHRVSAQAPGSLVQPAWLSQHVKDRNLVILQIGPKEDYDKEHIAGARFVQLSDISTPPKEGTLALEMPPDDSLRWHLEHLGISDASQVVVVFTSEWYSPATRIVFTLNYAGLGDHAMLLDGGLAAWKRAGQTVTAAVPQVDHAHLAARFLPANIVDHAYVESHESAPHVKIIDARAPEFFAGPPVKAPAGSGRGDAPSGHIPGAANLPFGTFFDDSGRVLSKALLADKFRTAGVQPGDTVVAYCHVGQQATVVVFAARLLGFPVRLYDGSMQDWSNRKLPLEGAAK